MALKSDSPASAPRNPGPNWGYSFLHGADRILPAPVFNVLLGLGTWIAVAAMPSARRYSREYLTAILGRAPRRREIWQHFFSFMHMFMVRLRVAGGRPHRCRGLPSCEAFRHLMSSGRQALLGTFHVGNSDLLGFQLSEFNRRVHMIRLRVGNSRDTSHLAERFGQWITYIWVNEANNLLFVLKQAVQSGDSVAMKCDRPDYSAKLEAFEFLGERRLFPFTIYHLALMFRLPVVFCLSVPGAADESLVHSSPVFEPDDASKADNLARARVHFQEVLALLESLLRAHPFLWFNFLPLNPVASASTPSVSPKLSVTLPLAQP